MMKVNKVSTFTGKLAKGSESEKVLQSATTDFTVSSQNF